MNSIERNNMQLISKRAVKYDPTLFLVSVMTENIESYTELTNFCYRNSILCEATQQTLTNGSDVLAAIRARRKSKDMLVTMRITESQLTEIILHFG